MLKKKKNILFLMFLLTLSLVGCGKDKETTNADKNTTEHSTREQATASDKTTEESFTTTEDMTLTTESIDQLQIESKENPLQFGDVVTIHTEYMPDAMDLYEVEAEISITGYENEYISCDVNLKNVTPIDASNGNMDIFFDCNFMSFTLYDENYVPIDYGYPINSLEGFTQGESNRLTMNQVHKGTVGSLKGSYDGAIPKYISFEYGREYTEQSYIPYHVYYEIPDGLFDTSYIYVDMSVMGADTAEQALELCKEAINNNSVDISKKISFNYYVFYENTGRVLLEEWDYIDYLGIDRRFTDIDLFRDEINSEQEPEEEILELNDLENIEYENGKDGGIVYPQAGYCYTYYYKDEKGVTCIDFIYLIMCDNRWFVICEIPY